MFYSVAGLHCEVEKNTSEIGREVEWEIWVAKLLHSWRIRPRIWTFGRTWHHTRVGPTAAIAVVTLHAVCRYRKLLQSSRGR